MLLFAIVSRIYLQPQPQSDLHGLPKKKKKKKTQIIIIFINEMPNYQ